jgi:type IV secretory pathway VirB10-like protein
VSEPDLDIDADEPEAAPEEKAPPKKPQAKKEAKKYPPLPPLPVPTPEERREATRRSMEQLRIRSRYQRALDTAHLAAECATCFSGLIACNHRTPERAAELLAQLEATCAEALVQLRADLARAEETHGTDAAGGPGVSHPSGSPGGAP